LTYDIEAATRRTKRKLRFWRISAVVLVLISIGILFAGGDSNRRPHIARLTVDGMIVQDEPRNRALLDLADSRAEALIVHVNSPGGTVVGGEDLYRQIETIRETMPVVTVLGTVAASAGYMVAISGDRIFTREGTITGSIGVLIQTTDLTELMSRVGISAEAIKSSPLKAQPSPLEPLSDDGRAALRNLIDDMYQFFVSLVADRRELDLDEVLQLADGRVYTGRQALELGLVDAIGSESDAIAWLANAYDIDADLPVIDLEIERDEDFVGRVLTGLAGKSLISNTLTLDGLISLWQPEVPQ